VSEHEEAERGEEDADGEAGHIEILTSGQPAEIGTRGALMTSARPVGYPFPVMYIVVFDAVVSGRPLGGSRREPHIL
jgi:hypothetical protein